MVYSVAFLKDGVAIDKFVFLADGYPEFMKELARVRAEFRTRRAGLKEVMSVASDAQSKTTLR